MRHRTIYCDPPWNEQGGGKIKRGADRHYPLMKTKDIISYMQLQINLHAEENCHLYVWVTNNFLSDGLQLIEELGFRYITTITWVKDRIGLGQYYRGMTEHCLFAVRGMLPYRIVDDKRAQGRTVIHEKKREHSRKPEKMYEYIELVSHPPRIEFFARHKREGWVSVGGEDDGEKR